MLMIQYLFIIFICLQTTLSSKDSDNDNIVVMEDEQCDWSKQNVWYPPTKSCEKLLQLGAGDCSANEWLVLTNNTEPRPICEEKRCPGELSLPVINKVTGKEECYNYKDTEPCPIGMMIVATPTGQGMCDCKSEHIYYPQRDTVLRTYRDQCHPLYKQGPCPRGKILYQRRTEREVKCHLNPCTDDKINIRITTNGDVVIPLGNNRVNCVALFSKCPGSDNKNLEINPATNQLECIQFKTEIRVLIDAPVINCPPGSRRDALGKCRKAM